MHVEEQRLAAEDGARAKRFWQHLAGYYVDYSDDRDVRTRVSAEALLRSINAAPGAEVLDAGCGHMRITAALLDLRPDLRMVGVDITPELLEAGKKRNLDVPTHVGDLNDLPFEDDRFDHAISARVFQYIADPVHALRELRRVVRPGGRVAIVLPNRHNPIKRLRYRGRLSTPAEVASWFEEAGFTLVQSGSACFVPRPLGRSWDSPLRHIELLAHVPLLGLGGGNVLVSGRTS